MRCGTNEALRGKTMKIWTATPRARFSRSAAMCCAVLIAGWASGAFARQSSAELPTVSQVLNRYVEATGGREALLRHASMTSSRSSASSILASRPRTQL